MVLHLSQHRELIVILRVAHGLLSQKEVQPEQQLSICIFHFINLSKIYIVSRTFSKIVFDNNKYLCKKHSQNIKLKREAKNLRERQFAWAWSKGILENCVFATEETKGDYKLQNLILLNAQFIAHFKETDFNVLKGHHSVFSYCLSLFWLLK